MTEDFITWDLGDDTDCELCGFSINQVIIEQWEDQPLHIYTSIGCQDGEAYEPDEIDKLISDISGYEYFDADMEKDIREKLAGLL